jgi:pimeloyl-ACP methyl ester carboxylesterase
MSWIMVGRLNLMARNTAAASRWGLNALAIIVFVILLIGSAQLFAWHSFSRQQLGLADLDVAREQAACKDGHIPIQYKFNAQQGAHDYLQYAVAAADVYGMDGRNDAAEFTLDRYGDNWANTKKPRVMTFNEGFLATDLTVDHYVQDSGNRLIVLVAFRGTFSPRDWLSNASWFLRWLPIPNHYDDARQAFEKIRADALKQANGRPVNFVVTGHSLGGGLAMHIAYGYPCVSAVVFNASPVINRYLYQTPFDDAKIAHIFQNCEVLGFARRMVGGDEPFPFLSWFQNLFGGEYISTNYHYYNYDAQNNSKEEHEMNCFRRMFFSGDPKVRRLHNMDNYVQGLSRTAAACESDDYVNGTNICSFHGFDAARRIYCIPRKRSEHDPPCLCRKWPAERRANDMCFAE